MYCEWLGRHTLHSAWEFIDIWLQNKNIFLKFRIRIFCHSPYLFILSYGFTMGAHSVFKLLNMCDMWLKILVFIKTEIKRTKHETFRLKLVYFCLACQSFFSCQNFSTYIFIKFSVWYVSLTLRKNQKNFFYTHTVKHFC